MKQQHYFDALKRLIAGTPIRIKHPYRINNDTVALEAGMKRGAIKTGRDSQKSLTKAILKAREEKEKPYNNIERRLTNSVEKAKTYKQLYQEGLNREIMQAHKIRSLMKREQI